MASANTKKISTKTGTITLLDDTTRPKGPTFDNLTIEQRAPGRHLQMIHNHFKQNMGALQQIIAAVESGEMAAREAAEKAEALPMLQNYRQFGALCGQHCQIIHTHHSIEDAHIFPALSEKSEAFKNVVDRLIAEHEIVHALLIELIEALNDLGRMPAPSAFARARELYTHLETVLLSHFGYEEDSIGDALGVYRIGV